MNALELKIDEKIEAAKQAFIDASHAISARPELQNQEFFACETLTKLLIENGFTVKTDIAGHKTGFIAEKSSSNDGPSIAFLAEYDALPDIGHGCGHNIIGTLSALGAVGLSEILAETGGKVFVYGTPAEEGGDNGSAKASFVDGGFFEGIDAAMLLHPSCENSLTPRSLGVRCYSFEFFGKTAHAAGCPQDGINALDAMILFFNGINALRQQTTDDVRIHGVITDGGKAPNVIPDYTKANFFVRAATKQRCDETLQRVIKVAEGAAISTGCTFKEQKFNNDVEDIIVNGLFDDMFKEKAEKVGLKYDLATNEMQASSDVGNVSHVIPVIQPFLRISLDKIPGHTVEFAKACVSEFADEALVAGAKALALTGLELLTNRNKLDEIKELHRDLINTVTR